MNEKPKYKRKSDILTCKVTPAFKKKVEDRAESLEMNPSEYIRYLILKDLEDK